MADKPRTTQKALRSSIRTVLKNLPHNKVESQNERLQRRFLDSIEYKRCTGLGIYLPIVLPIVSAGGGEKTKKGFPEVDTLTIIREALEEDNKRIFVPTVLSDTQMAFTELKTYDEISKLPVSQYGIPEPQNPKMEDFRKLVAELAQETVPPNESKESKKEELLNLLDEINAEAVSAIDLMVVPGLAFHTVTKMRVGRGKGYYDRYLDRYVNNKIVNGKPVQTIGFAFHEQMTDSEMEVRPWDKALNSVLTADQMY